MCSCCTIIYVRGDDMTNAYEVLESDIKLNEILDNANYRLNELLNFVNETTGKNYCGACHGRYHAMYVVKVIEHILRALSYDNNTVELGKIAGLLHDIGCTYGKKEHAWMSSNMCVEFLNKTNLAQEDKYIIFHAIQDHSNGNNINSVIGAALLIADKIDVSKNRGFYVKKDLKNKGLIIEEDLNKKDDLCEIEDIDIIILNNVITFNFITNGSFSKLKDILLKTTMESFMKIEKGSKYLNCICVFKINGEKVEF